MNTLPKSVIESSNHIQDVKAAISSRESKIKSLKHRGTKCDEHAAEMKHDAHIMELEVMVLTNALELLLEEHGQLVKELC